MHDLFAHGAVGDNASHVRLTVVRHGADLVFHGVLHSDAHGAVIVDHPAPVQRRARIIYHERSVRMSGAGKCAKHGVRIDPHGVAAQQLRVRRGAWGTVAHACMDDIAFYIRIFNTSLIIAAAGPSDFQSTRCAIFLDADATFYQQWGGVGTPATRVANTLARMVDIVFQVDGTYALARNFNGRIGQLIAGAKVRILEARFPVFSSMLYELVSAVCECGLVCECGVV